MKIYTRVVQNESTDDGRIEAFAGCGCMTVDGKFRACKLHAVVSAELGKEFLRQAAEEQKRYDSFGDPPGPTK
jgi:hypothetical protein